MSDKKLFSTEEFMFGRKGPFARLMAKFILWAFGAHKATKAYNNIMDQPDQSLATILREIKVGVDVDSKSIANIPAEGPAIVICNHPTGIVDGIVMLYAITQVRQDVKVLGNFLLNRVEPITPYLFPVNPFEEKQGGSLAGLKLGLKHLSEGGCLLLCPAGEVSTWHGGWGKKYVTDKEWHSSAIKLIRKSEATIVPSWIDARNSTLFHLLGKIHPRLRTAMLLREIFNKKGKTIPITIGSALPASRLKEITDFKEYRNYLRATVDYLRDCREKPVRSLDDIAKDQGDMNDIIPAIDKEVLAAEIASLPAESKLFDHGDHYSVYLSPSAQIPNLMQEIGRQREITFRSIGEGSMKPVDIDKYDDYYHQLFIWDHEAQALVGAYRMGFGSEIMPKYGLDGFYTHSLFRYNKEMEGMLTHAVELGRSFITASYQRKPTSLLMLWKGIFHTMFSCEDAQYLVGPVTISGEFQRSSKTIIMTHLTQQHFDHEVAAHIHPCTGAEGIDFPINSSLIERVDNISLIDKIVCDIEKDERSIPVLIKKYLQLGSRIVGYNVDHDFCDALDALMILDLQNIPEQKLHMLFRDMNEEIVQRFIQRRADKQ
jgi:putative hemolysin